MLQIEKNSRICLIKPDAQVQIKLATSPFMVSGGDFRLYAADGVQVLEQFKLVAEDGGFSARYIKYPASKLNKCFLAWQILTCTKKVSASDAEIILTILQNEYQCKLSVPTNRHLHDIAPCQVNHPTKFTESLMFVHKI